jgi:hypothetical protein
MLRRSYFSLIVGFILLSSGFVIAADFAVLSLNPSAPQLSRNQVRMIFSGRLNSIDILGRLKLLDWSKECPYRSQFYQDILNKSVSQVNRNWAALAFSGKAQAPEELLTDEISELVRWLERNPEGLAYTPADLIPEKAIVVYRTP